MNRKIKVLGNKLAAVLLAGIVIVSGIDMTGITAYAQGEVEIENSEEGSEYEITSVEEILDENQDVEEIQLSESSSEMESGQEGSDESESEQIAEEEESFNIEEIEEITREIETYDTSVVSSNRRPLFTNTNDFPRWESPIKSHLISNSDGTYTRVEYKSSSVYVEDYTSDFKFVTGRIIPMELTTWGGFYSGSKYNFMVFGQNNLEESDTKEVVRVVRYSKSWQRVDSISLNCIYTYIPFDAGTVRMTELNDILYIHTCREMYAGSDGVHHQSNMTFLINCAGSDLVFMNADSTRSISTKYTPAYNSHSFNQFVCTDGTNVYTADHGDAYDRGIIVQRLGSPAQIKNTQKRNIYPIPGGLVNPTGVFLGGFEVNDSNLIVAANSIDLTKFDENKPVYTGQRNIFIAVLSKSNLTTGDVKINWLTHYTDSVNISSPSLVKINNNKFLVLWEEGGNVVKYVFIDGNGNKTSEIVSYENAFLWDGTPILTQSGEVAWYITGNTAPKFCVIGEGRTDYAVADVVSVSLANNKSAVKFPTAATKEDMLLYLQALPKDVSIKSDLGNSVTLPVTKWSLDEENSCIVGAVNPSLLPKYLKDPDGLLNNISIPYTKVNTGSLDYRINDSVVSGISLGEKVDVNISLSSYSWDKFPSRLYLVDKNGTVTEVGNQDSDFHSYTSYTYSNGYTALVGDKYSITPAAIGEYTYFAYNDDGGSNAYYFTPIKVLSVKDSFSVKSVTLANGIKTIYIPSSMSVEDLGLVAKTMPKELKYTTENDKTYTITATGEWSVDSSGEYFTIACDTSNLPEHVMDDKNVLSEVKLQLTDTSYSGSTSIYSEGKSVSGVKYGAEYEVKINRYMLGTQKDALYYIDEANQVVKEGDQDSPNHTYSYSGDWVSAGSYGLTANYTGTRRYFGVYGNSNSIYICPINQLRVFKTSTITYNLNSQNFPEFCEIKGNEMNPKSYEEGQSYTLSNPTAKYLNFNGWYKDPEFTQRIYSISTSTYGDLTLYAKWTATSYSITLYPQGGTLEGASILKYSAATLPYDLPVPQKDGFVFDGWYLNSSYTGSSYKKLTDCSLGSVYMYAKWKGEEYAITYELNGGTLPTGAVKEYSTDTLPLTLPTPSKEGYRFAGWYSNEQCTGTALSKLTDCSLKSVKLYAKWVGEEVAITYILNSQNLPAICNIKNNALNPDTYEVEKGCEIKAPSASYLIFKGWYDNDEFTGDKITSIGTQEHSKKTLYAKWEVITYTITYHTNDGLLPTEEGAVVLNYDVTKLPVSLPAPSKNGYDFDNWYASEAYSGMGFKEINTTNIGIENVYAKWNAITYNITYYTDGGDMALDANLQYTIEALPLTLGNPVKAGYTFKGWFNNASLSGQKITEISENTTGNLVFYAKWVENTYSLAYNYNNGSDEVIEEHLYTESFSLKDESAAALQGYILSGWNTKADGTGDSYGLGQVVSKLSTGDKIVLYAKWAPKTVFFGDITPEDREEMHIEELEDIPESIWVAGLKEEKYFNGKAQTLSALHVYDYNVLLKEGRDYSVKYLNNVKAGTATVKITGKGDYTNYLTRTFTIAPLNLGEGFEYDSNLQVMDIVLPENGKVQKGKTTVVYNLYGQDIILKEGKDFVYQYSAATDYMTVGDHEITIAGIGNYEGLVNFTETIVPKDETKPISKVNMLKIPAQDATGKGITPSVVLTDGEYTLNSGIDYNVNYLNNVKPGTAKIVINGIGKYTGSRVVSFKINALPFKTSNIFIEGISSLEYTGEALEHSVLVLTNINATGDEARLEEKKDYLVSYQNNVAASKKATVVFTGIGKYSGTIKKTFTITPVELAGAEGTIQIPASVSYTKGGVKVLPTVTVNGEQGIQLINGKDYTVKYLNNTMINDCSNPEKLPTVVVTGKGNYKGELRKTFVITNGDLSEGRVYVKDMVVSTKPGIGKPVVSVYDSKGTKLAANKEYDTRTMLYTYAATTRVECMEDGEILEVTRYAGEKVEDTDYIPVNTVIQVKVSGLGVFAGTEAEGFFRISAMDISKAKVTVPKQIYTGKEIQPGKYNELTNPDGIKVKIGTTELTEDDFEIVSYSNNTNKGTATVVIRGTGLFCGEKKVTFKIVSKSIWGL